MENKLFLPHVRSTHPPSKRAITEMDDKVKANKMKRNQVLLTPTQELYHEFFKLKENFHYFKQNLDYEIHNQFETTSSFLLCFMKSSTISPIVVVSTGSDFFLHD